MVSYQKFWIGINCLVYHMEYGKKTVHANAATVGYCEAPRARRAPRFLQHSVASALLNRPMALTHAALQAFAANRLTKTARILQCRKGMTNCRANSWPRPRAHPGSAALQSLVQELPRSGALAWTWPCPSQCRRPAVHARARFNQRLFERLAM